MFSASWEFLWSKIFHDDISNDNYTVKKNDFGHQNETNYTSFVSDFYF